jgi:hypothetical protein
MTAQVEKQTDNDMGQTPSSPVYPLNGDADFAFRTGDRVLFGLHRALLKRASPVISDMLSLGGTKPGAPSTRTEPGEHVLVKAKAEG